jgi:nucleoside-diphosphate-sugar epimerase
VLGDILNPADIMKAAAGVDAIINLAAKHHDFGVSRDEFFSVNEQGTKNILECAGSLKINNFIFYSTVAVYGTVSAASTEETLPQPINNYGASKLAAEAVVRQWGKEDPSRQITIFRPTVVFGPENYANMYNLIDKVFKKRFIFVGNGENIKSVAYVENLTAATIFALERLKPGVRTFNYSDYPQLTSAQIVAAITKSLDCKIPGFKIPLKPALICASIFDVLGKITGYNFPITAQRIKKFNTPTQHNSDKIRAEGFCPPVAIEEGIRRMAQWYLQYRDVKRAAGSQSTEG